ncbi:MAG: alkaline phosphatase [candidate division KSB1 bacterium]|nr:alkaline phosphatase [candidate division KSB1 bacterium]
MRKIFLPVFCFALLAGCSAAKAPKNVILIIGDGMGFNQMEAASCWIYGQEGSLIAQKFPIKAAVATFSASGHGYDPQKAATDFEYLKLKPTDSAAAATAMACGVKTRNGAIGVDTLGMPLPNVFEQAEKVGRSTGVVTSVPFSHATPAGFIAHDTSRGNYHIIAEQMLLQSAAEVVVGGGHPFYNFDGELRAVPKFEYVDEMVWQRVTKDGAGADADGDGVPDPWTFVDSRAGFQQVLAAPPKRLFGVAPVASTLQFSRRGGENQRVPFEPPLTDNMPSLAELSSAALAVLEKNPKGFYVMIEAGAIDWACHANHSARLIEEMRDFENTVKTVVEWVESRSSWEETLLIVTADHETGYLWGPNAGNIEENGNKRAFYPPIVNRGRNSLPDMQWHSDNHSNQLVPLYAKGKGAEQLLKTVRGKDSIRGDYIDNTDIPAVLRTFL